MMERGVSTVGEFGSSVMFWEWCQHVLQWSATTTPVDCALCHDAVLVYAVSVLRARASWPCHLQ